MKNEYFTRRGRKIKGRVSAAEAELFEAAAAELLELIENYELPDPDWDVDPLQALNAQLDAPPPTDPVLMRLLPTANHDDVEVASSFRRLTEHDLISEKQADLRQAITWFSSLKFELDPPQTLVLLRALNDVRIAVATQLGIETDADAQLFQDQLTSILLQLQAHPDSSESFSNLTAAQLLTVQRAVVYDQLSLLQQSLLECCE